MTDLNAQLLAHDITLLSSPTPFPVGAVNVYLLPDGDGVALVDTGLQTPESREALERVLADRGLGFADVTQILLTHGHVDHCGLARDIHEASGCPIFLHPRDEYHISPIAPAAEVEAHRLYADYMAQLGWSREVVERILGLHEKMRHLRGTTSGTRPYSGPTIAVGERTLRVIPTPGHSPGSICLLEPEQGWLFAGDTLLQFISPNPLLYLGDGVRPPQKFESLTSFLASLDTLGEQSGIRAVLPGHGRPFRDHLARIAALRSELKRRRGRMARLLARYGRPVTAREIAERMFPRPDGLEAYLIASEVVASLEVLVNEGLADFDAEEVRWAARH